MKKYKHYVQVWLAVSLSTLAFIGVFNFVIDPYQQYRHASFYPVLYNKNQRYMIPGMTKNYVYGSIVIGSSMTQNFLLDDVRRYLHFIHPIKLTPSSTTAYEAKMILDTAFRYKKIKHVLYGLDLFAFDGNVTRLESDVAFPFYLYDDDIFNDYQYIANFDIFLKSIKSIVFPLFSQHNILYDYDHMWQWQHEFKKFKLQHVYDTYMRKIKNLKYKNREIQTFEKMKLSFQENLLKLIKKHSDTQFIIFYPPYSILTFLYWEQSGFLTSSKHFKTYVFNQIKSLHNVQIYDFQIADKIVLNLKNYRDFSHYHQKINTWMLEQISIGNYRVTEENLKVYEEKWWAMVQKYKKKELEKSKNVK